MQQPQQQVSTGAALGRGSFEFEGQTWAVGPLTLDVEAAFEDWLKLEAAREVERLVTSARADGRPTLGPATAEAMLAGLRGDLAAHRWAFEGADAWAARHQPVGARMLTLYRMQAAAAQVPNAPRPDGAWAERLWRDRAKWAELQAIFRGLDDPNPSAPQAAGAGD